MSFAATRAVIRVGWRNVRRNKWRSALIVLLVLLPVAAMAGAMTAVATTTPSADRQATYQMGAADMIVWPSSPDATTDRLRAALPAGSRIEQVVQRDGRLQLPGQQMRVVVRALDLNGLARGMMTLVDGRLPSNTSEVAVTRALADVAHLSMGDSIVVDSDAPATIVGYVEDPTDLRSRTVLEAPATAAATSSGGPSSWLVALPADAALDQSIFHSTTCAGTPLSENEVFHSTFRADFCVGPSQATLGFLVLGALVLVESALVAAAAFAVGIRRRQRELGVLAAIGAKPRQLAATVVAEAVLLGLLGSVLGVVVGVVAMAGLSPWLDELTNKRNGPLVLDPGGFLAAGLIGVGAVLLAGLVPAWSAARQPVLTALSGRRPAPSPAHRLLLLGAVLVILAITMTSIGAAISVRGSDSPGMVALLLVGGAIVGVFGFGATTPWLVERFEWLGRRLPVSMRLAMRDAARSRSRQAPVVTAALATLAATVAFAAYSTSSDAANAAHWQPWLLPDQLKVTGEGAPSAGPQAALALGAAAGSIVSEAWPMDRSQAIEQLELPGLADDSPDQYLTLGFTDRAGLDALGAASAADDFDRGNVIVLLEHPANVQTASLQVDDAATGTAVRTIELRATAVVVGVGLTVPRAVVSAATAARLGLGPSPNVLPTYLIRLPRTVTQADVDVAAKAAAGYDNTWADGPFGPPGSFDAFRWVLIGISLLVALSVTAVAVALGEAESRQEQRTLLAVGADPRIRRRITAARAALLALLAGLLAIPAGLIPAWGLLAARDAPLIVPLPEILAAALVLPLVGALGSLALSRSLPAWSALRDART